MLCKRGSSCTFISNRCPENWNECILTRALAADTLCGHISYLAFVRSFMGRSFGVEITFRSSTYLKFLTLVGIMGVTKDFRQPHHGIAVNET